jgi:hypothetical protein
MYRVPQVQQNSGLCWGCIQAYPIPNLRHHLFIQTNRDYYRESPWWLTVLFMFVVSIILGGGNSNNMARIIWDMGKKQHRQEGMCYDICLPAYEYCLCQRLTGVWDGLWKMNNKQFIVGRSGSSEVLCIWISTILYFATVTAICGPRRWSNHARVNALCQNM